MITARQTLALATTLLALGILSGCATMSQDECRMADWYSVGFEDGVRGAGADNIGKHREACAEHGIAADVEVIRIQQINDAYARLLKGDVRWRFVIDMSSLKNG